MGNIDLILRWSIGDYDTMNRTIMSEEKLRRFVKMAKLSVYSFQRFFDADFYIGFNGENEERFHLFWNEDECQLKKPIIFLNQREFPNPYPTFFPLGGVWWKWVPFRLDVNKTEISIDTDIICVNEPVSWKKWITGKKPLLISHEAIPQVNISTCGDVWDHMTIRGRRAFNCGIIGQKKNIDYSERFFQLTELVDYSTWNGNFVTEQGLFNILYRSLEEEGIEHFVLPYEENFQARHLIRYLEEGKNIETVHFTTKSKLIFYDLYSTIKKWSEGKEKNINVLSKLTEWCSVNKDLLS